MQFIIFINAGDEERIYHGKLAQAMERLLSPTPV